MSDQSELERLSEMLPRLAMAVIFQSMRAPGGSAMDKPHLRHCWLIAKSVERIADSHGYWSQEATQALLDMQQAMLEALRVLHEQERGVPPEFEGPLFEDGTGRQYRVRRCDNESDAEFGKRVDMYAKVRIRFEDPDTVFEQVVFIEQDRQMLLSKVADLQRKMDAALEKLSAAERYLDGDHDTSDERSAGETGE